MGSRNNSDAVSWTSPPTRHTTATLSFEDEVRTRLLERKEDIGRPGRLEGNRIERKEG
jgi:hypothetical protein